MSAVCTPVDVSLGLCHTMVLVINKNYDCKDDLPPVEKAEPQIEESKPPSPVAPEPELPELELEPEPLPSPPRSPSPIEIQRPIPPSVAKAEEVVVVEIRTPVPKTPTPVVTPQRTPQQVVNTIEQLMKEREERENRNIVDVLEHYSVEEPEFPLTPLVVQAPPVQEPEIIPEPLVEDVLPEVSQIPPKKPPKVYDFDPKLNTDYRAEVRRMRKAAKEEAEKAAQHGSGAPTSLKHHNSGSSAGRYFLLVLNYYLL